MGFMSRRGCQGVKVALPALLLALRDAERAVLQGATADLAVTRAVSIFHVEPAELRRIWLEKLVQCEQARSWMQAE